jgi:hypothetical protein
MAIRRIVDELEARLQPPDDRSRAQGKLERKCYADGTHRLKISVRRLGVPDGATGVVSVDGSPVAEFTIARGAGRTDVETATPGALPAMRAGTTAEARVAGQLMLRGVLHAD